MIKLTDHRCNLSLIKELSSLLNFSETVTLNEPTGRFFYDYWRLKEEFQGTIFEAVLNTLKEPVGEARVIPLEPGTCYYAHSDIDDRWHLTLSAKQSYLVDLTSNTMFETKVDGAWYLMDTSLIHSAVNFGDTVRYELVVRKLLMENIESSVKVKIVPKEIRHDIRYLFDQTLSPWLNKAVKSNDVSKFYLENQLPVFNVKHEKLAELEVICGDLFLVIKV